MARTARPDATGWVSVSDLAEYAYCPRALWYRYHPPPKGPTPSSEARRARGQVRHTRELTSRVRWERRASTAWWLLGVGALLCLLAWGVAGGW